MPSTGLVVPRDGEGPEVELVPGDGRATRRRQPVEQPPPLQGGDARRVDDVRREGVAGEGRAVDGEHAVSLPGEQHGGRRAGGAGPDDDGVVGHVAIVGRTERTGIGELPYLSAESRRTAYAGGLGTVAEPQLRQDVADVVLDRLAADEESLGDLRVGQSLAEQLQDVVLALGELLARASSAARPSGRGASARRWRHRRSGPPPAARRCAARAWPPRPRPPGWSRCRLGPGRGGTGLPPAGAARA